MSATFFADRIVNEPKAHVGTVDRKGAGCGQGGRAELDRNTEENVVELGRWL